MARFKISRIVRDSEGDVVPTVEVTVNQGGTSTKQTIYSDAAGTVKANPLTSGTDGRYEFWVDEGVTIDLDFLKTGFTIPSEDGLTVPSLSEDHGELAGLGDDDHTQYALLAGRAGGQTIFQGLTVEGAVVINDLGANVDFRVEGDTDPNLVFAKGSTDRVGIGTDSPNRKLDVNGSIMAQDGDFFTTNSVGTEVQILYIDRVNAEGQGTNQVFLATSGGSDDLNFKVGGSVRMKILDTGNVGIGKSPGAKLDIDLATEDAAIVDAGSTGATQQDWIEVTVGGVTGYLHVFAAK